VLVHDRHDLNGAGWDRLEPQLPDRTPARGGRWPDHRQVINGVFWRTPDRGAMGDLPTSYGNWKTAYSGIIAGQAMAYG
jgi:transposase